ncbi:MAG: hypothetical protein LBQ90_11215 [Synergistaceae bacterium]|nr:hypothetical protein [Synergistaceae bacterium]
MDEKFRTTRLTGFTPEEREMNKKLNDLFCEWYSFLDTGENRSLFDVKLFVSDGFYPYYTTRQKKILFIGQEALCIGGDNYIDILYGAYKENCIGGTYINQHPFHRRMLKIAYGLVHGALEWDKIPPASDLTASFGGVDGLSFAFMNFSKLSNDSGEIKADVKTIDAFGRSTAKSPVNFFEKEIEILAPDLVIAMNLGSEKIHCLGDVKATSENRGVAVNRYSLSVNDKKIPLLETYHFSGHNLSDAKDIYEPLVRALENPR